jgi:DNA-binding GntR family transcriptional regulator
MRVTMRAETPALPARERSDWKRIAEALELDVIVGRLHLRERLVEDEVMQRFDASRYSVRRAFDEMQALGLVVRSENRGVSIRGFTTKEVADLFELREILESAAALQIPMPVAAETVDRLAAIQKKHDAATRQGDFYQLFRLNNEFHQTLYSSCGNEALTKAIARYSLQVQPIRMRFVHDAVRRRQIADEHWAMIEAIRSQDNAALARICAAHLAVTKTMFLRSEGEPARATKAPRKSASR